MPKRRPDLLYIGVGSHIVAINTADGTEVWRTKLKATAYVTLYHSNGRLYAGAAGELFCVDAQSGAILWHNKLKGLGTGLVSFGSATPEASSASANAAAMTAAMVATTAAATA
ncbi:MAG: PQQ-like beta-propeller repeat protein [Gemmatimonadaceae bacterium]|jgi:outer membrane protein assembly factor BamB|nr:PQQ-like beta-propeller repeat protein [Gemmatimonadaceae bacterium]